MYYGFFIGLRITQTCALPKHFFLVCNKSHKKYSLLDPEIPPLERYSEETILTMGKAIVRKLINALFKIVKNENKLNTKTGMIK